MSKVHTYKTLVSLAEGKYTEKGSKFLAMTSPAQAREDVQEALDAARSAHPKARHVCYAWRILEGGRLVEHSTDAGEPGGSAGSPILNALKSLELINIVAVVVRYYGGKKLGIPGLIHAYRASTEDALTQAKIITYTRSVNYRLTMPMALQPLVLDACKRQDITVSDPVYDERFHVTVTCPMPEHADRLLELLRTVSQQDLASKADYLAFLGMEVYADPEQ